jgi:hypothetical protein
MARSNLFLIGTFCIAFTFVETGCKDNGTEASAPFLQAQVVDEQGSPLQDVGVHYVFDLKQLSELPKVKNILPSTTISYELPHPGYVTLKILRWYSRELITTLVDTRQNAGIYRVSFDASQVTNGVYIYRLSVDTTVTEKHMILLNAVITDLIQTRPLVTSDARGQMVIANEQFGFGVPFIRSSSSGNILDSVYISPAIQLVLYKGGYQTLVQPILIDPAKGMRVNFVLRR